MLNISRVTASVSSLDATKKTISIISITICFRDDTSAQIFELVLSRQAAPILYNTTHQYQAKCVWHQVNRLENEASYKVEVGSVPIKGSHKGALEYHRTA